MRKVIVPLVLLMCLAGTALADVLYLKDGSVLKGVFVTYENGEFVFDIADGIRTKFPINRVLRLVTDRDRVPRGPRGENYPQADRENPFYPGDSTGRGWENAAPFDVRLQDQWIRSQVQVYRGQRVRVEASGTLTLGGQATVGPDGLGGQRDPDAPMSNENDGALIAAIGHNFDAPLILIGRSREFTADRDGVLYFNVNHQGTASSRGAFRVNVSVNRGTGGPGRGSAAGNRAPLREKTITVAANQPWTDAGIELEPHTRIEIIAEGSIEIAKNRRTGPDGDLRTNARTSTYPISSKGAGAVIAKIRYRDGRDSGALFIGSRGQAHTEANEYGRLLVGINDDAFQDNTGSYWVTIRW